MRTRGLAAILLGVSFGLIFMPAIGHGFIKDDFGWIAASRVGRVRDVAALFGQNVGFYRPLVSASFALDQKFWHLDAFGYGLTNLLLFVVDAALVFCLAKRLSLPTAAAALAVGAWAFNFQGVNMALLWISGRTALLLGMFALAAALAVLDRRWIVAGFLSFLAMLCKEEAVLMPLLFVLFEWRRAADQDPSRAAWTSIRALWPTWIAVAVYLILRQNSGAFGPLEAPPYYTFTFAPLTVGRNVLEYLHRGGTFVAGLTIVLLLFAGRMNVALTAEEKQTIRFGAIWFVCFCAITVFLPVRSSLYALVPSIGSALVVATIGSAVERISLRRFDFYCAAMALTAVCLIPAYSEHNHRWVDPANLSASVLQELQVATAGRPGGRIVLVDDPSAKVGLDDSFGGLFPEAVRLMFGATWTGEIATSIPGTRAPGLSLVFMLRNGGLMPVSATSSEEATGAN